MFCKVNYKVQLIFLNLNTTEKPQKKLSDPSTSLKYYSTLLKTLLNSGKIPCILLPFEGNKFITDF